MKLLKTAALLAVLSSCALAQNLNVKIIQRQSVKSRYQDPRVTGATLTLQLPDGRVAVVTCTDKPASLKQSLNNEIARRGCRVPLVDEIEAEFKGGDMKLTWSVSLDNKKHQSETYTVVSVR